MLKNVDLLLSKLRPDTLAYNLVKLLKETPKENRSRVLGEKLKKELEEKKQEIISGEISNA